MRIHLLCRENASTPVRIVEVLTEMGVDATAGRCYPADDAFVISYGIMSRRANLNSSFVNNKMEQLTVMKEAGIKCPEVLFLITTPSTRNEELDREFKRYSLSKLSLDLSADEYPIIGRRFKHARGRDIVFINNPGDFNRKARRLIDSDFLVKRMPIVREFRAHVLGQLCVSISEKTMGEELETLSTLSRRRLIRSHRYGWINRIVREGDPVRKQIARISKKVSASLGFDFCAIDLALSEDNNLYVFEANSAPILNDRRVERYCDYFISQAEVR